MRLKDTDGKGMANSGNPDQTAPVPIFIFFTEKIEMIKMVGLVVLNLLAI